MHTHDVRTIETVGSLGTVQKIKSIACFKQDQFFELYKVLSAGVDTKVVVAKQKRKESDITKTSTILQSFRQTKICSLAREKNIFALQGESKIDLWKMSKVANTKNQYQDGEALPCDGPVHLASLNTESLRTARISPNGKFLAFSTLDKLRIYKIDYEGFSLNAQKVLCCFVPVTTYLLVRNRY